MSETASALITAVETSTRPATAQTSIGAFKVKKGLTDQRYNDVVRYLEANEATGVPCTLHFVRQTKGPHTLLGSNVL